MGLLDFIRSKAPASIRGNARLRAAAASEDLFDDEFQRKLEYLATLDFGLWTLDSN